MWKKQNTNSFIRQVRKRYPSLPIKIYNQELWNTKKRIYQVPWGFIKPTLNMGKTHKTYRK